MQPATAALARKVQDLDLDVWNQFMQDDDIQKQVDAAHSHALVSLLRSPLGYQGLLGLDGPPTSIQHDPLSDLWE